MMDDSWSMTGVDDETIRREKSKARDLRKSRWWANKIACCRCSYCGAETPAKKLTMDHIVPIARGGQSSKGNITQCCKECNTKKKNMLPIEWQEYMDGLK